MKTLKDQVDLTGEVEVISMTELRARPGDCVTQASLGKCLAIARNDKVIAFLVPVASADVGHEILPDGSCKTLNIPPMPVENRGCSVLDLDDEARDTSERAAAAIQAQKEPGGHVIPTKRAELLLEARKREREEP